MTARRGIRGGQASPDEARVRRVRQLAAQAADPRLAEIVDRWLPLADWQKERLAAVLLAPGGGGHGAD